MSDLVTLYHKDAREPIKVPSGSVEEMKRKGWMPKEKPETGVKGGGK